MFPCTSCGLCCQNITNIKELNSYDLGNGTCKYFDLINNECTIYDGRPSICRIDKMFDLVYSKKFTQEEFYIGNANVCNHLQGEYKMDKSFRVKIGE